MDGVNSVTCDCATGFTGETCETGMSYIFVVTELNFQPRKLLNLH